jgi:hypothetical protein
VVEGEVHILQEQMVVLVEEEMEQAEMVLQGQEQLILEAVVVEKEVEILVLVIMELVVQEEKELLYFVCLMQVIQEPQLVLQQLQQELVELIQ